MPSDDDVVGVVIERAMRYDLAVAVHDHGDAEGEAQEERAKGLQAVEPFRHKTRRFLVLEEYRELRGGSEDCGGGVGEGTS